MKVWSNSKSSAGLLSFIIINLSGTLSFGQEFRFQKENLDIRLETGIAPTFADIDDDGDWDLFLGAGFRGVFFFRNTGTAKSPFFQLESTDFTPLPPDFTSVNTLAFADIDGDGDDDLFEGRTDGIVLFFKNEGTPSEPSFAPIPLSFLSRPIPYGAAPILVDIDSDGDLDLFVGRAGKIYFYRNHGSNTKEDFQLETMNFPDGGPNFGLPTPVFADIDSDGDFDLFSGADDGNITFYRNVGSPANPIMEFATFTFASIDVGHVSKPTFIDIDSDGDLDFFVGERTGELNFFRNITVIPQTTSLDQNYPNPFNSSTVIPYQLAQETHVNLSIINTTGQYVVTLTNSIQGLGSYSVRWDGRDGSGKRVSSGIYIYRIETPEYVQHRKLALIR